MASGQPENKPNQPRPLNASNAPDPSRSYERAKPEDESGMGRLDNNRAIPTDRPDEIEQPVKQKQAPRQINAQDTEAQRPARDPGRSDRSDRSGSQMEQVQPDHSMNEEEPLGEDLMPTDIHDKRQQRQPRTDGKGGTP